MHVERLVSLAAGRFTGGGAKIAAVNEEGMMTALKEGCNLKVIQVAFQRREDAYLIRFELGRGHAGGVGISALVKYDPRLKQYWEGLDSIEARKGFSDRIADVLMRVGFTPKDY